ncbi:NarK family nitrate/nitrite MFS transporter [Synechococcus sp. PCC 7336]|uniref:NarK family nitrate/nitrite MFS transporter n=1 Tax=Synechococcus sp. PCC 7336 TaxID=195250 RepID=UPI0003465E67|nr:NarK family nitrate/nitrite MFS transporter [Synechococcus sp. PCC 7336]
MLTELFQLKGRYKVLHLTWFAFFLSFVVWFNYAPLATTIQEELGLSGDQRSIIGLCNIALTVPARIVIGMLLDKYGPRLTYSVLLIYAAIPCIMFASATSFEMLVASRLLLGIVGAGFVIGIRMVAEWFPPKEIGLAEGIYGGWGNFGSAAAALSLVAVAGFFSFLPGGHALLESGNVLHWRAAIAFTGIFAALYGVFYYFNVQDTPDGRVYQRPTRHGGMEVTSRGDFYFLLLMNLPLTGVMCLLAWRLWRQDLYSANMLYIIWAILGAIYLFQALNAWNANRELMVGTKHYPSDDRYSFNQVAILELTYIVNFGSELAVVTVLPLFFQEIFNLTPFWAGVIAASYAFMNLMSRPGGGLISDSVGSRKWTMAILTGGMGIGYMMMGSLSNGGWLVIAVLLTMTCSFFVQAGEGSTFAIVPLIKRRVTGQVAGNVGAYGNVGAVCYLTTWSLLPKGPEALSSSFQTFFLMLGSAALVVTVLCAIFLKEPKGSFAEFHEGEEEELDAMKKAV